MKRPMVIVLIVGLVGVLVVPPVLPPTMPPEGSGGQPEPPKEKVALM
jgi:hypothetical protein